MASPCRSASLSLSSIVLRPRSARKTSSGPAGIAIWPAVWRTRGNHSALAETRPSRRSEWPDRYFVPASIAMSTPWAWGGKKSGVAQVLSIRTQAPRACATSAIAGTSWISKLCEPGDSVSTALVFGRMSASMPSADARVVKGRLDPHALQNSVGEGARGPIGRVGHQQVVAGREGRHQRHDDRRKARRDELGPRRAGNVGPGRRERVRRRRAMRPIGVALGAALQRLRVGIEHGRAAKRRHIDEPLRLAAVAPEMDEARAALERSAGFVGELGHEGRWVSGICVRPLLARLHPRLHPAWRGRAIG